MKFRAVFNTDTQRLEPFNGKDRFLGDTEEAQKMIRALSDLFPCRYQLWEISILETYDQHVRVGGQDEYR